MNEWERKYKALYVEMLAAKVAPIPEAQDYLDLDAAGFLLVALGHLVKARELLEGWPKSTGRFKARYNTVAATNFVRYALENLRKEKEETCEKS